VEIHTEPSKGGKTVLIVEDNATIRKMIADAFLSDGFKTCVEADNGKAGIEAAKRVKPDVITLDLLMPVLNGLEAAPELRKLFPKIPIILVVSMGRCNTRSTPTQGFKRLRVVREG